MSARTRLSLAVALGGVVAAGMVLGGVAAANKARAKARRTTGAAITFDGGNAFVFDPGGGRVDAGAVRVLEAGSKRELQGGDHDMYLVLEHGTPSPPPSGPYLAPNASIDSKNAWQLKGYDVSVCPDGNCPQTATLTVPSTTVADKSCRVGTTAHNMYYLPDMLALTGTTLPPGWCGELQSRLILATGQLQVTSASHCFEFQPTQGSSWQQALANGVAEIEYSVTVNESLVLQFRRKDCTAESTIIGAVAFKPDAQGLALHVRTKISPSQYGAMTVDDEVTHFQPFFQLVPTADRVKLIYKGNRRAGRGRKRSPGSECPAVRFGGPAVAAKAAKASPEN